MQSVVVLNGLLIITNVKTSVCTGLRGPFDIRRSWRVQNYMFCVWRINYHLTTRKGSGDKICIRRGETVNLLNYVCCLKYVLFRRTLHFGI
jgi:hypothetical protein